MCAYLLSHFSSVRLFVIPWTITHQASLFMGFSQEYRSGLPCPPPGDLPDSGLRDQTHVSCLLHWQAGFLPLNHQGSPLYHQFSSVQSLSRVRLCNPMNRSMPGLPVHHQFPSLLKLMSIESVIPYVSSDTDK